jgi:hypothetical protein
MSEMLKTDAGMIRVDLCRADFRISGDLSKALIKNIQYFSLEMSRRSLNNVREQQLTLGIAETLTNIRQVNDLALADVLPKSITIETLDKQGQVASRRIFEDFNFQFSSLGFAVVGTTERPMHKIVWECHLIETYFAEAKA